MVLAQVGIYDNDSKESEGEENKGQVAANRRSGNEILALQVRVASRRH